MRTVVVFYAWQSDRPNNVNRGFIERALEDAAKRLNASSEEIEIKIDQDTQGVSGMPPVSETILEKIANCDIFLPDLTFVSRIEDGDKKGQPVPNANVLIEFGHALSARGHYFLMPVMNTAFGGPQGLPFDMGHLRNPILYSANPSDDEDHRRKERTRLSAELQKALITTINAIPEKVSAPAISKEMKSWAADHHSQRTNSIYQLIPVPLISGPKLLMHLLPLSAYDESTQVDFAKLAKRPPDFIPFGFDKILNQPDVYSWRFFDPPSPKRDGMFPGRIEPLPGQSMWFVEVFHYGSIELVSMIDTIGMPMDKGRIAIEGTLLEALIVNSVEKLFAACKMLDIQSPAILRCSLLEVGNCSILSGRAHGQFNRQPIFLPEIIIEKFDPPIAGQLRPMLDSIWRAAGVAMGSPSFATEFWAGYKTD